MTPLERSARALAERADGGPWEHLPQTYQQSYMEDARAVFEAARYMGDREMLDDPYAKIGASHWLEVEARQDGSDISVSLISSDSSEIVLYKDEIQELHAALGRLLSGQVQFE